MRNLIIHFLGFLLLTCAHCFAQSSQILGEVELIGASKVERTSGVWVDGQYLGYLKELKGSKKILLLPGEDEIIVRQDGYQEFTDKITLRPGEKQTITVKMAKDPRFKMPSVFSEIKLSVTPDRAAVFAIRRSSTSSPARAINISRIWKPISWGSRALTPASTSALRYAESAGVKKIRCS